MVNRKALVLSFIKQYFADHGCSPSYGEIAAGLNTNRERVYHAVRQLTDDGDIVRVPGQRRSIALPDPSEQLSEVDALRQLRRIGWRIDLSAMNLLGPLALPVTNPTLPLIPELDHIPEVELGDIHDQRASRTG